MSGRFAKGGLIEGGTVWTFERACHGVERVFTREALLETERRLGILAKMDRALRLPIEAWENEGGAR